MPPVNRQLAQASTPLPPTFGTLPAEADTISYSCDSDDQLMQEMSSLKGTTAYGYDANGSAISKARTGADPMSAAYVYDLEIDYMATLAPAELLRRAS